LRMTFMESAGEKKVSPLFGKGSREKGRMRAPILKEK